MCHISWLYSLSFTKRRRKRLLSQSLLWVIGGFVVCRLISLIGIAAYGWVCEMITTVANTGVMFCLFAKLR